MTCGLFRYLGVAIDKRVAALQVREYKGFFTLVRCLCLLVTMMDDACVTHLRQSIPSLHHLELLWTRSGVCVFARARVCVCVCLCLCLCSFVRLHADVRACILLCASCVIVMYAHRCDDYETSATLLVNAAIALSVTTIVLMKDDCNM